MRRAVRLQGGLIRAVREHWEGDDLLTACHFATVILLDHAGGDPAAVADFDAVSSRLCPDVSVVFPVTSPPLLHPRSRPG